MTLLSIFGASALLLALIGIYGLMACVVQQRTREIAVRLAVGADTQQIIALIIREGLRLTLLGIAVGLAVAAALARFLAGFLFGVQAWDPLTFASSSS